MAEVNEGDDTAEDIGTAKIDKRLRERMFITDFSSDGRSVPLKAPPSKIYEEAPKQDSKPAAKQ